MDILDEFPGEFFRATELVGKRLPVTITVCQKVEMNDGKMKPVLRFEEDQRGLVLNSGNRAELIDRFGRKTEAWAGQKVVLITRRVQGPNGPCHGIRFADAPIGPQIDDSISLDDPLPSNMLEEAEPIAPKKTRAFK